MGERKGVNKYYPPDYDPSKGGLNKWQGTHALRERAKKIHLGILVIRFEMPYNIWCDGCKNHIGMGVRYNAEKSKVGMYYTTPIYQFKMKCALCPNYIVIKTDPGNLDYEVVSGARRQERRFDPTENGTVVPDQRAKIQKLATDSMYKLEHGANDVSKLKGAAPALEHMERIQDRMWDDFAANKHLRDKFRAGKKAAAAVAALDADLLRRASLDLALTPETAEDRRLAALMRLQDPVGMEERRKRKRAAIGARPALGTVAPRSGGFGSLTGGGGVGRTAASIGVTVGRSPGTAGSSPAAAATATTAATGTGVERGPSPAADSSSADLSPPTGPSSSGPTSDPTSTPAVTPDPARSEPADCRSVSPEGPDGPVSDRPPVAAASQPDPTPSVAAASQPDPTPSQPDPSPSVAAASQPDPTPSQTDPTPSQPDPTPSPSAAFPSCRLSLVAEYSSTDSE